MQSGDGVASFPAFHTGVASVNDWQLRQAVRVLRAGGIIAYPTEAVWGLGCDPFNPDAVNRLLEIKRRPMHKGLILAAATQQQIGHLITPLSPTQRACLDDSWPGPNTWLLPDPEGRVPGWIKGRHSGVAVRVSAHPVVQALCAAFGGPLVSTSANTSNAPPARSKTKVRTYFGCKLDFIVDGQLGGLARPTTIRSLFDMAVVRS